MDNGKDQLNTALVEMSHNPVSVQSTGQGLLL